MKVTGAFRASLNPKVWDIREGFPSRPGQSAEGRAQDAVPVIGFGSVAAGLEEAEATTLVYR